MDSGSVYLEWGPCQLHGQQGGTICSQFDSKCSPLLQISNSQLNPAPNITTEVFRPRPIVRSISSRPWVYLPSAGCPNAQPRAKTICTARIVARGTTVNFSTDNQSREQSVAVALGSNWGSSPASGSHSSGLPRSRRPSDEFGISSTPGATNGYNGATSSCGPTVFKREGSVPGATSSEVKREPARSNLRRALACPDNAHPGEQEQVTQRQQVEVFGSNHRKTNEKESNVAKTEQWQAWYNRKEARRLSRQKRFDRFNSHGTSDNVHPILLKVFTHRCEVLTQTFKPASGFSHCSEMNRQSAPQSVTLYRRWIPVTHQ